MAEQPDAGDTDETASDAVADPPVDSDASDAPVDASTDSVDSTTADSADPADPADCLS